MSAITSITTHFLADLPEEASLHILSNFDVQSLGKFCQVSHAANRLASDDRLWTTLVPAKGIPEKDVKAYIARHVAWSFGDLFNKVQQFAEKIHWGQTGKWVCTFPYLPEYEFTIGFVSGDLSRELGQNLDKALGDHVDVSETVHCMQKEPNHSEPEFLMKNSGYPGKTFVMILGSGDQARITELADIIKTRLNDLRRDREYQVVFDDRMQLFLRVSVALSAIGLLGLYFLKRR